jgi:hypothetical protein
MQDIAFLEGAGAKARFWPKRELVFKRRGLPSIQSWEDLLPGGGGVRWLDALRLAGQERAMFLTKVGLIKAMLAAYYHRLRLRITICEEGLHHETTVGPRRLERCGQCLHLFDLEREVHFFLEADSEIWVGFHGKERLAGIHIFSGKGRRRGVIQFAGRHDEAEAWNSALWVAAGKMLRE